MILYKYVDASSLGHFFKDGYISIKFTPHGEFNDPFESYGYSIGDESLISLTMRHEINKNLACLCLSKNPLNVLMWAHYGDEHRGFAVEIDTEKAGFDDESHCIITAPNGDIDYLEERIKGRLKVDQSNVYRTDIISKLLLNKSVHWKYEEEVRVIKKSESLTEQLTDKGPILITKVINLDAVTGIYIGMRNANFDSVVRENSQLEDLITNQKIKLYRCDFKKSTWDLDKEDHQYVKHPHMMDRIGVYDSLEKVIRNMNRDHIED